MTEQEMQREQSKQFYAANRESVIARVQKWQADNPEWRERQKATREANPEKYLEYQREYRQKNRGRINQYKRDYLKRKQEEAA